jgi:hypothetical protein
MVTHFARLAAGTLLTVAACGDDDAPPSLAADLCPTVQAWADQTADVAGEFRLESREAADATARRAAYEDAFRELHDLQHDLAARLANVTEDQDELIATRLSAAAGEVLTVFDDGAAHAAELPDEAYTVRAVGDGTLFTSIEKAKAVVFQALADLADDATTGVPRGCGRRGALDLSPSATFPDA